MLMHSSVRWSERAGQRISLRFPFFMYLWRVIQPGCLDREITSCLPTNKRQHWCPAPYLLFTICRDVKVKVTAQSWSRVNQRPTTFHKDRRSGILTNKKRPTGWILIQDPQKHFSDSPSQQLVNKDTKTQKTGTRQYFPVELGHMRPNSDSNVNYCDQTRRHEAEIIFFLKCNVD